MDVEQQEAKVTPLTLSYPPNPSLLGRSGGF